MLEFLIENIFVLFCLVDVSFNRQSILLWVPTVLLFSSTFLYLYEADFIQELLMKNNKKLARSFNFTLCKIDDVISLNNSKIFSLNIFL